MIVDVSTILDCSAAKAWSEVQKSALLLHVIWPLARVVSTGGPFPERWSEGLRIQCRLFVFGVIPIGVHTLLIEKIDQKNYEIQSREHDPLIARWASSRSMTRGRSTATQSISMPGAHRRGLGMGQLVLPSSSTPMACTCKDIVTADKCSTSLRSANPARLMSAMGP